MIEQGTIQDTQERTVGPMDKVIAQYRRQQIKIAQRDVRLKRMLPTKNEQKALGFLSVAIKQLEGLNAY